MLIGLFDPLNNCDFAFRVPDNVDIELVKDLMEDGLGAWYAAAVGQGETIEDSKYFTKEEIATFYAVGYAEPAEILMQRNHIPFAVEKLEYDPLGNPICDDFIDY